MFTQSLAAAVGKRCVDSSTPADDDLLTKRFVNHSSAMYDNHASTLNSVLRAEVLAGERRSEVAAEPIQ